MFSYGLEHYQRKDILDGSNLQLPRLPVKNAKNEAGLLAEEKTVALKVPKKEHFMLISEDERLQETFHLPKELTAPVGKGTKIGEVIYTIEDEVVLKLPVYVKKSVASRDWNWYFGLVLNRFFEKSF